MVRTLLGVALATCMFAGAAVARVPEVNGGSPQLIFGANTAADPAIFDQVQYVWGGRRFCWYPGGWRGPGWYWCGYAWRRGFGWGGGYGWHGWRGGDHGWHGRGHGWHGHGHGRRDHGGDGHGGDG